MIITRTPFRASLAGGGSDLKSFYSKNGYGAVLSAAIQSYMYIVIHPYFHDKIRIKYSKTEDVNDVTEIEHPIVRECLKKVKIEKGIEIASFADVSSGTGLGSSSSFTVGLLNALYTYKGVKIEKEQLAREACEIEIDRLGEPIGKQDQYSAAFGGINYIRFNNDESVEIVPVNIGRGTRNKLESNLCLYYIGGDRLASNVLSQQEKNMSLDEEYNGVKNILGLVDELRFVLENEKADSVGEILHRGWLHKRKLAHNITSPKIDDVYEMFRKHGIIGGKLLGAGGGGFFLIYSDDHGVLKEIVRHKVLPFSIDDEGTKVIFNAQR